MVQTVGDELGRIPMSPALQASLMRARDYASQQGHTQVTLEHLLLALTEDEDAALVLQSSEVDLQRLRNDVAGHIGSQNDRLPGGVASDPGISSGLTQILKYATLAAKQGRRPRIDGAIVLAAIVGDGRSMAAAFLKAQGLTFEEAIRVLQQVAGPPGRRANAPPPAPSPPPVEAPSNPANHNPPSAPPHANGAASAVARTARNLVDTEDLLAAARARVVSRGVQPRMHEAVDSPSGEDARSEVLGGPHTESPNQPPPPPVLLPSSPVVDPTGQTTNRPAPENASLVAEPNPEPASAAPPRAGVQPPPLPWAPPPLPSMPRASRGSGTNQRPPLPAPPPQPDTGYPTQTEAPLADGPPSLRNGPSGAPRPPLYPPGPPPGYGAPPAPSYPPNRPPDPPPGGVPPRPPGLDGGMRRDPARAPIFDADPVIHSIPARLEAGVTRSVEVRVGRPAMPDGPGSRAGARGEPPFARAVSVRLRSAKGAPVIVATSPETQWDKPGSAGRLAGEAAVWRFLVTPSKAGITEVSIQVTIHVMAADGHLAERTLPEQIIPVKVTPNYARGLRRAALYGLTGLVSIAAVKIVEDVSRINTIDLLRRLLGL